MDTAIKCYVTFKDTNDDPIYKKIAPLDRTLFEIAQLNPDADTLWCEIEFEPNIDYFENFDLFDIGDKLLEGQVRITYNFNLNPLLEYVSEEEDSKLPILVEKEIWLKDKIIMKIIGATDFSVSWGGPNAEKIKSDTEVVYYIDYSSAFVFVPITIPMPTSTQPIMASTIEVLYNNAQKMSVVISEIIEAVKLGMAER